MLSLVALVFSCRKEELDVDALTDFAPGILELSPSDKQVMAKGDAFNLRAKFVSGSISTLSSATLKLTDGTNKEIKTVTKAIAGTADSLIVAAADFGAASLAEGDYKLVVEVKDVKGKSQTRTNNFKVGIIPKVGIIGSATPKGWGEDTDMTHIGNGVYEITVTLVDGEVKFRQDDAWTTNWGAASFPSGKGVQDGPNIPSKPGTWKVTFNITTGEFKFVSAVTYAQVAKDLYLLGTFNNFEGTLYKFGLVADNTWVLDNFRIKPGDLFKFSEGPNFMGNNWGDVEGDGKAEVFGPNIKFNDPKGEAYYKVTFNDKTRRYTFDFLRYPTLGIIGSATPGNWDTETQMQDNGNGIFEITMDLKEGEAKFRADNSWTVNWGGDAFPEGTATPGGANIKVSPAGRYKVTFDRANLKYKFVADNGFTDIGIIGDATPGGWATDTDMKHNGDGTFTLVIGLSDGKVKFRANNDWKDNWGGTTFPNGTGTPGGADIAVTKGIYIVKFNSKTGEYSFQTASIGLIGDATPGGWSTDTDMTVDAANAGLVKLTIDLTANNAKFRVNDDWAINWGGDTFPSGIGKLDGANIKIPSAGKWNIEFNVNTLEYKFSQ